jgi:soluble lytic murein transglycosylase-like protein
VKVMTGISAMLLMLAGCARAQQPPATAERIQELSHAWAQYYAKAYQVPTALVEAIIDQESAWNPYAVSQKGAAGLMQLMPKTAVRFGVRNRFRIEQNIQGGVAYLAWLNQQFNGDLRLVTAAYYAGEAPIHLRGLAYANPDVHAYVSRVAQRYRVRRALPTVSQSGQAEPIEVSHEQRQ